MSLSISILDVAIGGGRGDTLRRIPVYQANSSQVQTERICKMRTRCKYWESDISIICNPLLSVGETGFETNDLKQTRGICCI